MDPKLKQQRGEGMTLEEGRNISDRRNLMHKDSGDEIVR
jgi:hypothetical protein